MIINKYNDYMFEQIMESVKNDETSLVLSGQLMSLISSIDHPITDKFKQYNNNIEYKKFKITLLDINEKSDKLDSISFMQSNKAIQLVINDNRFEFDDGKKELTPYQKERITLYLQNGKYFKSTGFSETSLGKIVNKLFPGEFKPSGDLGNDIESFVNMYKSLREKPKFEIVKGDDIIHWYNRAQYTTTGGTIASCMSHDHCGEYLNFYTINPDKISLLLLKDPNNDSKIMGRAILWNLETPEDRVFMDRVYYTNDYMVNQFINYAKENGWLYKKNQNMDATEDIIDSKDGEIIDTLIVDDLIDSGEGRYPYMDTMKYLGYDGTIISNSEVEVEDYPFLTLDGTNGHSQEVDSEYLWYSEYYGETINTEDGYAWCDEIEDYRTFDDSYFSEYYDEPIAYDYAKDAMKKCEYGAEEGDGDNYRKKGDYVIMTNGKYSTKEFAEEENLKKCEIDDNKYIPKGYEVYSKYNQSWMDKNDCVKVWTNEEKTEYDWRTENNKFSGYFKLDGQFFDDKLKINK